MKIYLNGKFVEKEDAKVSVYDHGLLYGDGVFEGIRAYNKRVFRLNEHLKRLYDSARAIMITIPLSVKEMEKAVVDTLKINKLEDSYIRLVVTRGAGDLGLDPRKCAKATVFIIADKITLYPEELYRNGLELVTASTKRIMPDALNPCIKSLNYLNNIQAKIEGIRAGVQEAIMLNSTGHVAECTGDNIFIIKGKKLITPPSWAGALEGVTRAAVMDIAEKQVKMQVVEEMFTTYHIYTADECFLTGTGAEVIPVVKVDSRVIGDGKPGKYSLELIKRFRKLTQTTGTPIY